MMCRLLPQCKAARNGRPRVPLVRLGALRALVTPRHRPLAPAPAPRPMLAAMACAESPRPGPQHRGTALEVLHDDGGSTRECDAS